MKVAELMSRKTIILTMGAPNRFIWGLCQQIKQTSNIVSFETLRGEKLNVVCGLCGDSGCCRVFYTGDCNVCDAGICSSGAQQHPSNVKGNQGSIGKAGKGIKHSDLHFSVLHIIIGQNGRSQCGTDQSQVDMNRHETVDGDGHHQVAIQVQRRC